MPDMTLKEALELYKNRVSILKKGYAQEAYRLASLAKSPLSNRIVRSITSVDIADYRDRRLSETNVKTGKPISPATVRLEMSLLSNLFELGRIEWGICGDNPVKDVRKPKPSPGRERRLTPREDRKILRFAAAYANRELLSIIILALETAMRQGEILKLCWENINLRTRIAHLPDTKNGTRRDVPLSKRATDALRRLGVKQSGRVFTYTPSGLKTTWRCMTLKLNIEDLHFHDLRHEAVSRLFEMGTLDMMEIAAISGHKSLAMLKRYTHLKAQRLVRKLDGGRNRGRQGLLEHLVPYPAMIDRQPDGSTLIRLPDFDDLQVHANDYESALSLAQGKLLKALVTHLREGLPIPMPDEHLEPVDEARVVMIDPLDVAA